MPESRFPTLNIIVGTRCDFSCRHCLFDKKARNADLKDREITLLQSVIRKHAPRSLFFAGGEPSLYVNTINDLVSAHPRPDKLSVGITTNGGFAKTVSRAEKKISSIRHLRHVRMSYDKFHAEFVPISHVANLYRACRELGASFRVIVSMESPLDIGVLAMLRKAGKFGIEVQPVFNIGNAKKNKVSFRYPDFDGRILKKYCRNRGRLAYICGKGFSICCANLVFNGVSGDYVHKTPEEHMQSGFYKMMKSCTFGQIIKRLRLGQMAFKPEHSTECSVCEHLFLKYQAALQNNHMETPNA